MNFQQCRYVEAIAETGSFSEAAKKLYVTQPNLSSSIKELEIELGVQLFIRSNTGTRLTDDGYDFLKYAKRILGEIDLLKQRYQDNYKNSFTITSHHYDFLAMPLLDIAESFKHNYQHFHLIETTTKKILESVLTFESDLGILYLNDDNRHILERYFKQNDLTFTALGDFPTRIFLRKDHPLAKQKVIEKAQLKDYKQVRFRQETSGLNFDEDTLDTPENQSVFYSNDRGTIMNILCGSDAYASGLGLVNSFIKDQIVLVPLKDSHIHTLGFVSNNRKQDTSITQEFIKAVKESLKQYRQNTL
ncbi:LysR family transcriptional regulator [Streptococcus ratti]|uniref:LysR family transcriptional regulator n=2 Tax=Streptococcus ratti TaxID=1341 RepID=A0A7X9LBT4_STRRT|nr:LysR family transcriptional regulator [Streptococcus ratti]VEI60102.1 transcriptional regulator [Streptococcus mutans]EJN93790.1 putative transcriptional regulator [Streptococcus ratti FA-1 = DSM 20564]EMP67824.1 transcriptional regulator [Streptococcus ratti FA-1 = DSM 20564]NMD48231.1 LysR family transcriptional regulator [Streptococcus ratti]QEY07641.1 LysR family transcriptional regulator [Streptococcus ratti]